MDCAEAMLNRQKVAKRGLQSVFGSGWFVAGILLDRQKVAQTGQEGVVGALDIGHVVDEVLRRRCVLRGFEGVSSCTVQLSQVWPRRLRLHHTPIRRWRNYLSEESKLTFDLVIARYFGYVT